MEEPFLLPQISYYSLGHSTNITEHPLCTKRDAKGDRRGIKMKSDRGLAFLESRKSKEAECSENHSADFWSIPR